jgi:putative ABC transport system substrate-binding protein
MVPPEVGGKRLQLLKEVMPGLSRVAVLIGSGDVYALQMMKAIETVAQTIGVHLHSVRIRRPEEFERAFEVALLGQVDGLMTVEGRRGPPTVVQPRTEIIRIVEFAAIAKLTAIYERREYVEAGRLMALGPDRRDLFRRVATYVHRVLDGAKPADLPVELPTEFELTFNLKTANALRLAIPLPLLGRADVIE